MAEAEVMTGKAKMSAEELTEMLEAGLHFGHQSKRWNPKMARFIFGERNNIHIIDLQKTVKELKKAYAWVKDQAAEGKVFLLAGTKKQAKPILETEAKRCEMLYVVSRWLGGTLTNFQTIKPNIDKMRDLRQKKADGFFERVSKKDAKTLSRQLERLEEHFDGLAEMEKLPGCLFIVDIKREEIAVREANRLNIPIVAICDTNANPDLIAYPIPGNDDAIRAIQLVVSIAAERVLAGRRQFAVGQQAAAEAAAATAAAGQAAQAEAASVEASAEAPAKATNDDKPASPQGSDAKENKR